MAIYGEGECLYGLMKECRLGDKGIEVNPIYCLNCAILELAVATRTLKKESVINNTKLLILIWAVGVIAGFWFHCLLRV